MFGYIDESGAPGVASNNNDYLLVSLVVFDSMKDCEESINAIDNLCKKLQLPEDYEFHCSSNSTKPQTEFIRLISKLNFRFFTIAIRKNDFRKTASYVRLSNLLIDEVEECFPKISIEMDSNPTFYAELRKRIRERNLNSIKLRERNSRHNRLIQVADYVVNISAKKAKNTPTARKWYNYIAKKSLLFVEA